MITNGRDFSAILAATRRRRPSLVRFCSDLLTPVAIGGAVVRALEQARNELTAGAVMSVDIQRARLRISPE